MECNVSELVKIGHDRAADLRAACGTIAVAKLISDLATQLDCTALALREMTKKRDAEHSDVLVWEKTMFKVCGEDGPKSVADKFAALEARCTALAAENAGLKSKAAELVHEASEVYSAYNATITEPDGDFMDMQTLQEMQSVETPATDAFLAEVRASGVEMLASLAGNECQRYKSVNDRSGARKWKGIVILCTDFAAQIRKGVQS